VQDSGYTRPFRFNGFKTASTYDLPAMESYGAEDQRSPLGPSERETDACLGVCRAREESRYPPFSETSKREHACNHMPARSNLTATNEDRMAGFARQHPRGRH
jgi:hypothetical protein